MRLKGWKQVFAFTFVQQIKTKSFIIGTVIISLLVALIAFLTDVLPAVIIGSGAGEDSGSGDAMSIETLYLTNETEYPFDLSGLAEQLGLEYKVLTTAETEAKVAELAESAEMAMTAWIYTDDVGLAVDAHYAGAQSGVSASDCEMITNQIAQNVKAQFMLLSGMSEENTMIALAGIHTSYSCAGEEPISMVQSIVNTIVPMVSSLVLFIFIFSYSQLVAQAIAIEKSSRIIEYLLTAIRPLAVIVGKVLAMCCVSLMQFLIIGLSGGLGFLISMPFGIFSKIDTLAETAAGSGGAEAKSVIDDIIKAFSTVDASAIVIMLITFVLGFLFYAGIAGLAGSSVSKMEDLAPALQPLSIIGVLGFYLAYMPQVTEVSGETNPMAVLARYLPISSPFVLASDYMLGKISLLESLIAVAILAAFDVLIMMLVAKVYEHIILHTGSRLKISDMLKMAK